MPQPAQPPNHLSSDVLDAGGPRAVGNGADLKREERSTTGVLSFFISGLGQEPDGAAVTMRSLGGAMVVGVLGYQRHFFFGVLTCNSERPRSMVSNSDA